MLLLLHGDNHPASRQTLNQLIKTEKSRGVTDIIRLDGTSISQTDLLQALESKSLLGQEKLVVIEQAFSQKSTIQYLSQLTRIIPVIVWEPKALTASQLKRLANFTPQLSKTPAVIFNFLDSLKPSNTKAMLLAFQTAVKAEPVEQVSYMLQRRISQLIEAKNAPETLKLADWQKSKLGHQAKAFSSDQLTQLHCQLLDIDIRLKTGVSIIPLITTLELFLINL